jgi:adenylosuccinate synthase
MEPITAIITAIAAAAADALSPTAQQAVQDLYDGVKKLIQDKYHRANSSLEALEKKPESASKRESLQEDLQDLGAANDIELLRQSQALLKAIEEHAPRVAQAIGIKLEDVKAANARLQEIIVSGEQAAGVHIKQGEFTGDIEISKVRVEATIGKK